MDIQTLIRAQDVQRWNIVHTVKKQSLAEHTFNVMVIALDIARRTGYYGPELVMGWALQHDLDEIITGDIPSPTKARAKARGWDLNSLACEGHESPPEWVAQVVKAADLIENYWFIKTFGHGRHAAEVERRLAGEFESFMERNSSNDHFAAACRGVLHDLCYGGIAI